MQILDRIIKWYESVAFAGGVIAVVAVYSLTAVVCADVILRKLFNAPFLWTTEFAALGLICIGMLGAAFTLIEGGHIRLDILLVRLPVRTRAIFELCAWSISLMYIAVLFWITQEQAFTSLGRTTSGAMMWPLFPTKILIPIACVLLAIGITINIGRAVSRIRTPSHKGNC